MLRCQTEEEFCTIDTIESKPQRELPLITVGIVVLNRQWILKKMLDSLKRQTYPQNRLYVVLVDGGSRDNTVNIAQEFLHNSNFYGYEVIVQKCSIPEGRNLCIQNMKGDLLLFWDSDVVMDQKAISNLLEAMNKEKADIVTSAIAEVYIDSCEDIKKNWTKWQNTYFKNQNQQLINNCTMGNTLISKKVFEHIKFDNDLTYGEDMGFSFNAIKLGYKILGVGNAYGFDINNQKEAFSDHSFDMPLKRTLRGIRKKGVIEAVTLFAGSPSIAKDVTSFFLKRKRYAFYLAYIPIILLAAVGLLIQNVYAVSILPLYMIGYFIMQITKRGLRRGSKAVVRSILVGVPTTYLLLYYSLKLMVHRPINLAINYGTQSMQTQPVLPFAGGLSPDVT